MDSRYEAYIDFLTKYRDELSVFLDSEAEKRRALLDDDAARLEAMLKHQQAETMKFRGLESKRTKLQASLGLPDADVKTLLAAIGDEAARERIAALTTEMADIAGQIRVQNRLSLELAEANLKMLELLRRGGDPEGSGTYGRPEDGPRKTRDTGNAFEETV